MTALSQPSPSFIVCRDLQHGESLPSLIQWHCAKNLVPRLSALFALLKRCGGSAVDSVHELAQSPESLLALEWVTRQRPGALAHLRRKVLRGAVEAGYEERRVDGLYEWPQGSRSRRIQAVCPLCLGEVGYAFTSWEFVQAPVCLRHGVMLLERCPSCSADIKVDRTLLLQCANCGIALSGARTETVESSQLEAARRVQESRTLTFGPVQNTVPLEPSELSGLLRLLLNPRQGEPISWGLTEDLETLDSSRRMDALSRLGKAFEGPRLDSLKLGEAAMGRWPFAALLPKSERVRLLREACQAAALPPDVTAMLCCGEERELGVSAIEQVSPAQPRRILTLKQLGERLGLDREPLLSLLAEEGISHTKPADYGFDMDDVMHLENQLASMRTSGWVDDCLGWPGAAEQLTRMKLLFAVRDIDNVPCVQPRSVSRLFARVHERVQSAVEHGASMRLGTAQELGFDAERFAWAIAQVVGGSLPVHGWRPPFDLVSLEVCERRLVELAKWPQSEAA